MSELTERIVGEAGEAVRVRPPAFPENPAQSATLAVWFVTLPDQSPFWDKFYVGVIHLRGIDGVRPPRKESPDADYEVCVLALDPAKNPTPEDTETWHPMTPGNYVVQFAADTDDRAATVAKHACELLVQGLLPVEPAGVRNAREIFADCITLFLKGHPCRAR